MQQDASIELKGRVVEVMTGALYRVLLANGARVQATLAGEMRLDFIQVLPGDSIVVEFSPYDLSKGRIIAKINERENE